jgi:hypothetical protein
VYRRVYSVLEKRGNMVVYLVLGRIIRMIDFSSRGSFVSPVCHK